MQRFKFQEYLVGTSVFLLIATSYSSIQELSNLIASALCLIAFVAQKRITIPKYSIPLLVFILGVFLSAFQSIDVQRSLLASLYISYIIIISLLVSCSVRSITSFKTVMTYMVCALIVLTLRNLEMLFAFTGRFNGIVEQPNALGFLAGTSAILIFIYTSIFSSDLSRKVKLFLYFFISLNVIFLVASASRGAVISFVAYLITYLLINDQHRFKKIAFLLIIASILSYFYRDLILNSLFMERLIALPSALGLDFFSTSSGSDVSYGDDVRFDLVNTALAKFLDNPFFGNGASTFIYYSDFVYTHSSHMEILFAFGIFGFLFFYSFLYMVIRRFWVARRRTGMSAYFISLVVYFMMIGFSFPNFQSRLSIPIYITLLLMPKVILTMRDVKNEKT